MVIIKMQLKMIVLGLVKTPIQEYGMMVLRTIILGIVVLRLATIPISSKMDSGLYLTGIDDIFVTRVLIFDYT